MLTGIRKFELTTDAWTDIVAPFACSYFMIVGFEDGSGNRVDRSVLRCSDKGDATTAYTMRPGEWMSVVAAARFGAYRWQQGAQVGYLKAIDGPLTAIIEFFQ